MYVPLLWYYALPFIKYFGKAGRRKVCASASHSYRFSGYSVKSLCSSIRSLNFYAVFCTKNFKMVLCFLRERPFYKLTLCVRAKAEKKKKVLRRLLRLLLLWVVVVSLYFLCTTSILRHNVVSSKIDWHALQSEREPTFTASQKSYILFLLLVLVLSVVSLAIASSVLIVVHVEERSDIQSFSNMVAKNELVALHIVKFVFYGPFSK